MAACDEGMLIARLARFCAALYRTVPLEGNGLLGAASELAHAAELEDEATLLESGEAPADGTTVLAPRDIRIACQLLIDVRRAPNSRDRAEVSLAREHFPEVEEHSLDPLERLVSYYTALLHDPADAGEP